jgi:hypothetical protein
VIECTVTVIPALNEFIRCVAKLALDG